MSIAIVPALIGASAMLVPGMIAFFIAWGAIHATMKALETRVTAIETELAMIREIKSDVSYIKGVLDGEARAARAALERIG
jgi:hypothetical protein